MPLPEIHNGRARAEIPHRRSEYPTLVCRVNSDHPALSVIEAGLPSGERAKINFDITPTYGIAFTTRDIKVDARVARGIARTHQDELLAVFTRGLEPRLLQPADTPIQQFTRSLRFITPGETPALLTLSGIGIAEFNGDTLTYDLPVPKDQDLYDYSVGRGFTTLGTTIVTPDGEQTDVLNHGPVGAYLYPQLLEKIQATNNVRARNLPAVLPSFVMWGMFPERKFRGKRTAWCVYELPLSLWPYDIVSISTQIDAAFPYGEDGYPGNRIFESWTYRMCQVIRRLHDADIVHGQLHTGNVAVDVSNPHNLPVVTDLGSVSTTKKHDDTKRIRDFELTARELAWAHDLANFISHALEVYREGNASMNITSAQVVRIGAWIYYGYTPRYQFKPDLQEIRRIEDWISGVLTKRKTPLESNALGTAFSTLAVRNRKA